MVNQRLFKTLDVVAYSLLLATIFFVPFGFDNRLANFFIIPKEYGLIGLILLSLLLFAAKIVFSKKINYRLSILELPFLGLLAIALISAFFSANIYDSFLGRSEYFVLSFVALIFLVIFYVLIVNFFTSDTRWNLAVDLLIASGGLSAVFFILKLVFKLDILSLFGGSMWNTVDKVNSVFGIWMIIMFVLSAGQLIRQELSVGRSLAYFFVTILSFVSLVLLSFNFLWWILLIGLVLLLMLGISHIKEIRAGWLSVLFAVLIVVVVFITFGSPKSLQSAVPLEISLGVKPSWSISTSMLFDGVKNFLVGGGMGAFSSGFSMFRSPDFNYDNVAWSLRFNQPYNTLFGILAEGGVLFSLAFLFIILFALGHVFHIWFKTRGGVSTGSLAIQKSNTRLQVFLVAIAWVVLNVSFAFTFAGPVLWWLWWLMLGLIVSGLAFFNPNIIKLKEWTVEDTPQYSLSFSFVLIVVMAAVIMVGVWGARLYVAEIAYAKALKSSDFVSAEANLRESVSYRNNYDVYHAALAQVYLTQAVNVSRESSPNLQTISNLMALAVNEARAATNISPRSVGLWENLAMMYENAAALVPEARDWAIQSWQKAKDLEPTNPVLYWRLGNSYAGKSNWEEAIKNYQSAIDLKNDYIAAYISLAKANEASGQIEKAVVNYATILPAAARAGSVEVMFDYGRLLYNRNKGEDRDNAEKLWLEAVRLQPNYSNALYSLGLLYEARGERATALQYYYKVKDLNPDNKDIIAKIRSLVGE